MMTFTSAFGVATAFASRIGSTYVFAGCACGPFPAPAARGAATTSTAQSVVTRPSPPLPQSAFDRESPPRFPVPQRALERCSPRGELPLPLIQCLPFPLKVAGRSDFVFSLVRPGREPQGRFGNEGEVHA